MIQIVLILISLLFSYSDAIAGSSKNSYDTKTATVTIKTGESAVVITAEVADTMVKRSLGLMYRQQLKPTAGMLFIFPYSSNHVFWMKNTTISLDLIYIDDSYKIVGIKENTVPFSEKAIRIGRSSRYVLEINAGLVKKLGVAVDQTVSIDGIK